MHRNEELEERLVLLALRVIELVKALSRDPVSRHLGRQLLRAGTSAGANYGEARGAESRKDFTHKLGIVLKELKESRYWLRLVHQGRLVTPPERLDPLRAEVGELVAIFGKSVATLRGTARPSAVGSVAFGAPEDFAEP